MTSPKPSCNLAQFSSSSFPNTITRMDDDMDDSLIRGLFRKAKRRP
jgi:hypothetical protein